MIKLLEKAFNEASTLPGGSAAHEIKVSYYCLAGEPALFCAGGLKSLPVGILNRVPTEEQR